jgi:hypothetical protein
MELVATATAERITPISEEREEGDMHGKVLAGGADLDGQGCFGAAEAMTKLWSQCCGPRNCLVLEQRFELLTSLSFTLMGFRSNYHE